MADYLPRTDAELLAWSKVFATYVNTNSGSLDLSPSDIT